jgi:uncharacterized protein with HEPN domain
MRRRASSDYLHDILDSIQKARRFTENMSFEEFSTDAKTIYATVRALEIVGEATKRLPPDIRDRQSSIPWRKMAGIRDIMIHEYNRVDLAVVWKTVKEDLPSVEPLITRVLQEELRREGADHA